MAERRAYAVVRSFAEIRHSGTWPRWQALAAESVPFLAPDFFELTVPLADGAPFFAGAWEGDALVGALPLSLAGRTLRALRSDHSPMFDYCGSQEGLDAIWRALLATPGWDTLVLEGVPADSPLATRLPGLAGRDGCRTVAVPGARHLVIALPGFEANVSPKFLTNLRRCARKASGIELERIASPTRSDFKAALELEAMAWKAAAGTSIEADPHAAHLYRALVRIFGRRGRASLYFLRAGGERIAQLLALEDARTIYALKIGYDPRQSTLSPGHLLVWKVAEDARRRGLLAFDFAGRESEWKRKWTEQFSRTVSLRVYRRTPRGLALYTLRHVVKPRLPDAVRDIRAPLRSGCPQGNLLGAHTFTELVRSRIQNGLGVRSGIRRAIAGRGAPPAQPLGAASHFAAGSWVRVLDADRIRATLDESSRLRGLAFVPAQWNACGGVYRVSKHVRRMRDDKGRMRPISGTVMLEGVTCAGNGPEPAGCGRHCPLMFRDEWLEPAEAPRRQPGGAFAGVRAHVRSLEEIRRGLDLHGRRDGVTFMPEMEQYAGRRFHVAGQLRQVFELDRWVEARAGIYILGGLHCGGAGMGARGPCDRSCALLWHEDWLILEPTTTT